VIPQRPSRKPAEAVKEATDMPNRSSAGGLSDLTAQRAMTTPLTVGKPIAVDTAAKRVGRLILRAQIRGVVIGADIEDERVTSA
jgi:hypothetical protein